MQDPFDGYQAGLSAPASHLVAITPDDGVDLGTFVRAICVAGSGLVQVTAVDGSTASIYIAAGVPFPVRARRVWATGTDATGIVGLA